MADEDLKKAFGAKNTDDWFDELAEIVRLAAQADDERQDSNLLIQLSSAPADKQAEIVDQRFPSDWKRKTQRVLAQVKKLNLDSQTLENSLNLTGLEEQLLKKRAYLTKLVDEVREGTRSRVSLQLEGLRLADMADLHEAEAKRRWAALPVEFTAALTGATVTSGEPPTGARNATTPSDEAPPVPIVSDPDVPTDPHALGVYKVQKNFDRPGLPPKRRFFPPGITDSEFSAWQRGDHGHCGKKKWKRLDDAAARLPINPVVS